MAPKEKKAVSDRGAAGAGRRWAFTYGDLLLAASGLALVGVCAVVWQGANTQTGGRLAQIKSLERLKESQTEAKRMEATVAEKQQAIDALSKQVADRDQQIAQGNATIDDLTKKLAAGKRGGKPGKKKR